MSRKDRHRRPKGPDLTAAPAAGLPPPKRSSALRPKASGRRAGFAQAGRPGVDDMLLGFGGQAFAQLPDAAALARSAAQIRPDPIAIALAQARRSRFSWPR